MRVEPFVPDVVPSVGASVRGRGDAASFERALDGIGEALSGAQRAEDAFAHGNGSLHDAVYERARADVALAIATAAAQRTATALTAILNMPV